MCIHTLDIGVFYLMDAEYVELVLLLEEYKSHSEAADAEIARLRNNAILNAEKLAHAEADHQHCLNLMQEMEESVVHMDQEVSSARAELAERDEEIAKLQLELLQQKRNVKATVGSGSLQLSSAKDETRKLQATNVRLRAQLEELESTLNRQQSLLLDNNHISPTGAKNNVRTPEKPARVMPSSPSPLKLSMLDVVVSDIELSEAECVSKDPKFLHTKDSPSRTGRNSSRSSHRNAANGDNLSSVKSAERNVIAREAAHAALEREDAVRPIINRRDGSFGLSPTKVKASPTTAEKWAYTQEDLLNDRSTFGKHQSPPLPLRLATYDTTGATASPTHLPIHASKWSSRDDDQDVVRIFNFDSLKSEDKPYRLQLDDSKDNNNKDSIEETAFASKRFTYQSIYGETDEVQDIVADDEMRYKERSFRTNPVQQQRVDLDSSLDSNRKFKQPKGKTMRA